MEFINNFGPIGKFMYQSNISSFRYLSYYFDEQLHETNLYGNTYLMVNPKDTIPSQTTCLLINVKISFERLQQIICDSDIQSVVFFKDMFVENIDTNVMCRNITTIVCYNLIALNMISRFFPNIRHIYLFRQNETINGKRVRSNALVTSNSVYNFPQLVELHIYSSGSAFRLNAPNLEQLSVYSSFDRWSLDVKGSPKLHTIRLDEKILIENFRDRKWRILQFYPSASINTQNDEGQLDLVDVVVKDLILPPKRKYMYKLRSESSILGAYCTDMNFFTNILTIDVVGMQVFDNLYPLKMCQLRFSNTFYKYFPFPNDIDNELLERFNIQKQRENLIMIFNFDFMQKFSLDQRWQAWYNRCVEIYHRMPIIMQNGQLMLTDGSIDDAKEKVWPNTVNKLRRECVIFLPEEELIYINCSPLRLQTLVDKIINYRRQRFIINKLWLVTNGFEIQTKDIEERIANLVIVRNDVKMYLTF